MKTYICITAPYMKYLPANVLGNTDIHIKDISIHATRGRQHDVELCETDVKGWTFLLKANAVDITAMLLGCAGIRVIEVDIPFTPYVTPVLLTQSLTNDIITACTQLGHHYNNYPLSSLRFITQNAEC